MYLGEKNGLPTSGLGVPSAGPSLREQNPSFPHPHWGQWDLWVFARIKAPSPGILKILITFTEPNGSEGFLSRLIEL